MTKTFSLLAGALLAGSMLVGCGRVNNAVDCHSICNRYQTCFDKKYDVDACSTRCFDNAKMDPQYSSKADKCNACIDDKSCSEATFKCAIECTGIVP